MRKVRVRKGSIIKFQKNLTYRFYTFSTFILLLKVLWLSNQPGRIILGADSENYFEALDGLLMDGFYSQNGKLSYWPAGYPILMWPLARLDQDILSFFVGILQSLVLAVTVSYFAHELSRSSLKKLAWPSLILLNLSPVLTLNSVAIGYEVVSACFFLLAVSMYLRIVRIKTSSIVNFESVIASLSLMLSTFMQPRMILLAIGVILPFAIFWFRGKSIAIFLAFSMIVISIAPTILTFRNEKANGYAAISTNLGVTMNIGAGPSANGGYSNAAKGVPCTEIEGNAAVQDRHKVKCVISWYLQNPLKAIQLFANKFIFHWSPWSGPLANGTMGRNPWLELQPFVEVAKSQDGYNLVFGTIGKAVSWIWLLCSLALMGLGFRSLRLRGGVSSLLAWMLISPVALNTLSSMATIGDHRFRIPTLTLSLLLQLFGMYSILSRGFFREGIDGEIGLIRKSAKVST